MLVPNTGIERGTTLHDRHGGEGRVFQYSAQVARVRRQPFENLVGVGKRCCQGTVSGQEGRPGMDSGGIQALAEQIEKSRSNYGRRGMIDIIRRRSIDRWRQGTTRR